MHYPFARRNFNQNLIFILLFLLIRNPAEVEAVADVWQEIDSAPAECTTLRECLTILGMTSKSFKATELESEYTERRKFLAETANAKGKKADALFKKIDTAKRKLANYLNAMEMANADLGKEDVNGLIKLISPLENKVLNLKPEKMNAEEIEAAQKAVINALGKEENFPKEVASNSKVKTKLDEIMTRLKNYVKYRDLLAKADTVESHLAVIGGTKALDKDTISLDKLRGRREKRKAEFRNKDIFPAGIDLAAAGKSIDDSFDKLAAYILARDLATNGGDTLREHARKLGFDVGLDLAELGKEKLVEQKKKQLKSLEDKDKLPGDAGPLLERAKKKVEESGKKLTEYVGVREVAFPADDALKSHLKVLGLGDGDEAKDLGSEEIGKKAAERRAKFEDSAAGTSLPSDAGTILQKARNQIDLSEKKLRNYVKANRIASPENDQLETHLEIVGFLPGSEDSKSPAGEEAIKSRAENRRKEFASQSDFPSDGNELRKKAKKQVETSAEKLRNYMRIQPILAVQGSTLADLLKMLLPSLGKAEEQFNREQLEAAIRTLRTAASNLPEGIADVKSRIDEAYKKLKNYLKVRPRHLSRADTLDANLAVLGIDQGRRDSFDRRDIQRGSDISATLPTGEEDLPSDVKGIAQKIESAAHRLENFLQIRLILREAKDNSLDANWAILGITDRSDRQNGNQENVEKAAKERTELIEKWKREADKELPENGLPEVDQAIVEVGNAAKRLKNFLQLTALAKADLNKMDVDALTKLLASLGETAPKLEKEKMAEAEIGEAQAKVARDFLEEANNFPKATVVTGAKEKLDALVAKLKSFVHLRDLMGKQRRGGDGLEVQLELLGKGNLAKETMTAEQIGEGKGRKTELGLEDGARFPAGVDLKAAREVVDAAVQRLKMFVRLRDIASNKEDSLQANAAKLGFQPSMDPRKSGELTVEKLKEQSRKQAEFLANIKLPGADSALLEQAKKEVEEATKKLSKFLWVRDLVEKWEDNVLALMAVVGFPKEARRTSLTEADIELKATARKEALKKTAYFPAGIEEALEKATQKVDEAAAKLRKFVQARDIASPKDDRLKSHLNVLGFGDADEPAKLDEATVREKASKQEELFSDESLFPGDAITEAKKAKSQIESSAKKVQKYILAIKIATTTENKLEAHMKILGFDSGDDTKSLSEESVKEKAEMRRKELLSSREFPEDGDELRKKAKKQVDLSTEKLLNYLRLQPVLAADTGSGTVADLMKVLGMDTEKSDKFTREELQKARDGLVSISRLPEGFDIRQKVEEAFTKLKNYLKVRPRHLSRADTLDANLAVLGIDQGRRDSFDRRDIQNAKAITQIFPSPAELPSDIPDLRKKVEEAAKKVENSLLAREINKIGGTNLAEKWQILGIVGQSKQDSIGQEELKSEFEKRRLMLRPIPSDVDGDLALEKLNNAFWDLKEELANRNAESMKRLAEEQRRKEEKLSAEGSIRQREEARESEQRRPISEADCQDDSIFCHFSSLLCKNTHYMVSMQQSCRKSCAVCVPSSQFMCQDKNKFCKSWNQYGAFCGSLLYSKGMKLEHCAKTCELCP